MYNIYTYIFIYSNIYCKMRIFLTSAIISSCAYSQIVLQHERTEFFTTRHGLQPMHPLRARMRRLFTKVEVRAEKLDIQDRN